MAMGPGVTIGEIDANETVFSYIQRIKGKHDLSLYRQVIGAANAFKEGDLFSFINAATRTDDHLGDWTIGKNHAQLRAIAY